MGPKKGYKIVLWVYQKMGPRCGEGPALRGSISTVQAIIDAPTEKVFAMGMSNGGQMT